MINLIIIAYSILALSLLLYNVTHHFARRGHCRVCHFTGAGWQHLGITIDPNPAYPALHWWGCPRCQSTRVSQSPTTLPQ